MFSDPEYNLEQMHLGDGMIVADLGAGSGFYSLEAGKRVLPTGKVYAVDIQRDLLERLKSESHRTKIRNVEIIVGDLEKIGGSKIRDNSCNVVIISNILFMLENKHNLLAEAKRILRTGGRLLLIDWSASFSQMGPHDEHVIYKDDAISMAKNAGFVFDKEIDAGQHHYGIIFKKK